MRISKNKKQIIFIVGLWAIMLVLFMFNVPIFNDEQEQYDHQETVATSTQENTDTQEEKEVVEVVSKTPSEKPVIKETEKPGEVIGTEINAENIFNAVNKVRYDQGLPLLKRNAKLDEAAMAKAKDIVEKNYWSHTNPEGKEFKVFITESGYNYTYAGENLAKDFSTVQETVDAWIASPTHYQNMIKTSYKETGIAVIGSLVVQEFGTEIK